MDASTSSSTLTDSMSMGDDDSETEEAVLPKRPRLGSQRRSIVTGSGKYRKSWNIPFIVASTKGEKYAHCKLCSRDFSVSHGGQNDAKRH